VRNVQKFKLIKWWDKNSKTIAALAEDLAIVTGYLSFCYGIYQIYGPLMWICLGFGLIKLGGK
jgi:hypothetical protein